jgi:hypothetical protein
MLKPYENTGKLSVCLGLKPSQPDYYDVRASLGKMINKIYTDELTTKIKEFSPKRKT